MRDDFLAVLSCILNKRLESLLKPFEFYWRFRQQTRFQIFWFYGSGSSVGRPATEIADVNDQSSA